MLKASQKCKILCILYIEDRKKLEIFIYIFTSRHQNILKNFSRNYKSNTDILVKKKPRTRIKTQVCQSAMVI